MLGSASKASPSVNRSMPLNRASIRPMVRASSRQELLAEPQDLDAEVVSRDVVDRQAGDGGKTIGRRRKALRAEVGALLEGEGVFGRRILFDLGDEVGERERPVLLGHPAVVPGSGCIGGQKQHVGQVVAASEGTGGAVEADGLEVEHGRDEYEAVEVHPVAPE